MAIVSILIPCFNADRYVGEAIECALAQTWPEIEIVVVDDGSEDESVAIIERFRSRGVRLIRQGNSGAAAARNRALREAAGEYIQFLDADDIIAPRKIQVQMERLSQLPRGTVASGAWARFRLDVGEAQFREEPVWADMSGAEFLKRSWNGGGMIPVFCWLTPRSIVEAAGPWNDTLSLNDDGEFFTRIVLKSRGIAFCREAMGFYRATSLTSLSKLKDLSAMESGYRAVELSCSALLRAEDSGDARHACATQFQRFAYDAYPSAPHLVNVAERMARKLGGTDLRCPGGPMFRCLSHFLGWKLTRRMQYVVHQRA